MQAPHYRDCVRRVGLRVCYIRPSSAPGEVGKWSSGSIGSRHDPPSRERARARSCRAIVRPVWTVRRFLNASWTLLRRVPRASWDHHHMNLPAYLRGGVPLDWIVNIQQSHLETYERVPGQTSRAAQHYYRVGNDLQSRPSASTQQVTTYASTARRIAAVFTGASRQRSPTVVRSSSQAGRVSVILDRRPFSC